MSSQIPHTPLVTKHKDGDPPFDLLPKLINGAVAGIIGTALMFPFDLAKTRIQNQEVGPKGERMYKSMTDCLRKIVKYEGGVGLYRGCLVSVILIAPEKALKLTSNDFARYFLKQPDQPRLSLWREVMAGAFAGFVQNIFTTPMDLIKIQMQDAGRIAAVNKTTANRSNALTIAMTKIREKGIFGLYRGVGPTIYRNVFFSVAYFPIFYNINAIGPRSHINPKEAMPYWSFCSGCVAGAAAACAATPFDVVKTRMQRVVTAQGETKYTTTADAFVKIVRNEGPLTLMRGAGIRMLVIAPLFGIVQTVYYLGIGQYLSGSDGRSEQ